VQYKVERGTDSLSLQSINNYNSRTTTTKLWEIRKARLAALAAKEAGRMDLSKPWIFLRHTKVLIKNLNKQEMENLIDVPGGMIILDAQQSNETTDSMPELMKRYDDKSSNGAD
jgi:hypothetical protein